jgi:predicted dehydrogenase
MEVDMKKTRLGIVGPGLIWDEKHKPALKSLNGLFSIEAFSASSEESHNKISREYPGVPFYKDYRDLALSDTIDAVVVLTPIGLNAKVSMAALAAGKDVIVEKPMAANSAEARALIKKEKKTGNKVIILEQLVYKKSGEIIKDLINKKRFGDILSFEKFNHFIFGHRQGKPDYLKTAWRKDPDFMLGIFFDAGIHDLSELSMLFGEPASVYAEGRKYREKYGSCDQVKALFSYPGDVNGFYSFSTLTGRDTNFLNIRGTEGLVHMENDEIIIEDNKGKKETISVTQENVHLDMWKKIKLFLDGKELPYYTTSVSLKDIDAMEAIDKSLKSSCKIPVQ